MHVLMKQQLHLFKTHFIIFLVYNVDDFRKALFLLCVYNCQTGSLTCLIYLNPSWFVNDVENWNALLAPVFRVHKRYFFFTIYVQLKICRVALFCPAEF